MSAPLPFPQTAEGCRVLGVEREVVETGGTPVGVQLHRTRAVPGGRLARAVRFGRNLDPAELARAVEGLVALAADARVVRVHVEVYAEVPAVKEAVEAALTAGGFAPHDEVRSYVHTLWLDLAPSDEDLLGSFHRSARRNVRLAARKGHVVEPLGPGTSTANLAELYAESFESTGAEVPEVDWGAWLALTAEHPGLVHFVGIRPEDATELSGFAVAVSHGDVVEYHHAATTRSRESGVPLLYAPLWELMRWARAGGARWFDFGGVTVPDVEGEDPLEGISDFKRFFCRDLVRVGGEWVLDSPSVAGTLWRAARWLKQAVPGG